MSGQTIAELRIDSEFRALIPPLSSEEIRQLESNIVADGCRDSLISWNGVLVDGHNRHEICSRLSIPFGIQEIEFKDRDAALIWIIDNQKGRRNLADIDRIALETRREEIVARKAKESYDQNVGRPKKEKESSAKLPTIFIDHPSRVQTVFEKANDIWPCHHCGKAHKVGDNPCHGPAGRIKINTRSECAKAAGVGERTYDAGKLILKAVEEGKVKPEVVEDIRRGRTAIHRVAKDIKESAQREARQEKRIEAAKSTPTLDTRIIVGDFREHADKVADGSLSLIFTDPPYDREASKMLPALAEFASKKLADGGSLICYVGQTQLPAAMDAFRLHLRYWWTIACVHAGRSTVMREYGINAGWKAVLWFVKGTRDNNSVMVNDVMSGGEGKTHHHWQQSQSEAEYWIEKLCPKDGLVCDPFLGGGTTAAASKAVGREWIGFEIDETNAAIAGARVNP